MRCSATWTYLGEVRQCVLPAGHPPDSRGSEGHRSRDWNSRSGNPAKRRWDERNRWSEEPCKDCGGLVTKRAKTGRCHYCASRRNGKHMASVIRDRL